MQVPTAVIQKTLPAIIIAFIIQNLAALICFVLILEIKKNNLIFRSESLKSASKKSESGDIKVTT